MPLWVVTSIGLLAAILLLTWLSYPLVIANIVENVRSVCFMLLILVLLSRFHIGNIALEWLGKHVFLCYLLQRLTMILLMRFGINSTCIPLFIVGSALGTVLLVIAFDRVFKKFDICIWGLRT